MSAIPDASSRPPDLLPARASRPSADAACLVTAGALLAAAVIAAIWQRQPWLLLPVAIAAVLLGLVALRVRQQGHALRQAETRSAALAAEAARAQARDSLDRAHDAQVRQALDVSRTAMMIADNDHVIRYVNQSVVTLLRNQQASLREAFPDIIPGYHMNKRHWISLKPDGELEPAFVDDLVTESYLLVVEGLPKRLRPVDPATFGQRRDG